MTLNTDKIEQIKVFIKKKGFDYPDVQLEILDHVACKVEERLTENPNMSFDDALRKIHAEFGVFGFQSLEEPFLKNLEKKFFRMKWESFKSWFKIPQFFILVLALTATYLVSGILEGNALWVFPIGVIVYFLIFQLMVWRKLRSYRKLAIMKSFWTLNFLYNL